MFDVYLIADVTASREPDVVLRSVERALADRAWGARVGVQLRAKGHIDAVVRRLASALRAVTQPLGVPLLVNGQVEIAREVAADGVHLPEGGPPIASARAGLGADAVIGVSRHDAVGLARAAAEGADFSTLSPVFASPGKSAPLGREGFRALAAGAPVGFPLLALGGVDRDTAPDLVRAGAHGVAVIREVLDASDPARALAELVDAVASARGE